MRFRILMPAVLFACIPSCLPHQYNCYNIPDSAIDALRQAGLFTQDQSNFGERRKRLTAAKNWMIQLQRVEPEEIVVLHPDVLVVDYADDGGEWAEWKGAALQGLRQRKGGGERLVIAYLSIGEAENYRFYWQDWFKPSEPEWLDHENPNWKGNFKVKYWHPEWKEIIFGSNWSYLDRIINNGFDGVYLDMVDAYDYWIPKGVADAKEKMSEFVREISAYAKGKKSDFLIIPQNALSLLLEKDYLRAIDGIGAECVYYHTDGKLRNDCYPYEGTNYLRIAKKAGLQVFLIEYLTPGESLENFFDTAAKEGFIPYAAPLYLDSPGILYK